MILSIALLFIGLIGSFIATFFMLDMRAYHENIDETRFTKTYKSHPRGFEFLLQLMMLSFPLSIIMIFLNDVIEVEVSLVIAVIALWPFIPYMFHRRTSEFSVHLGFQPEAGRNYNPRLVASFKLLGWISSLVGIIIGVVVYTIFSYALVILGINGLIFIPLRPSIAVIRNKDNEEPEYYGHQETTD